MSTPLSFRPVRPSDYGPLADLICETWHYDDFCPPDVAHKLSLVHLAGCLCAQTYAQAAVRGDRPVGVIMGRDSRSPSQPPFRQRWFQVRQLVRLFASRYGWTTLQQFDAFTPIDRDLLARTGEQFDGELSFFAVSPREQGAGVGRALYDGLLAYFRRRGVSSFYLFTDTACNVGFYDHLGLTRRQALAMDLSQYGYADFHKYLYTGSVRSLEAAQ